MLTGEVDQPKGLGLLTEYLPDNTLVVFDEPVMVEQEGNTIERQFSGNPYCMKMEDVRHALQKYPQLALAQMAHDRIPDTVRLEQSVQAITGWMGNLAGFWEQLHRWEEDGYSVILICNNTGERNRLYELLEEQGFTPGRGSFELHIEIGRLHAGFASTEDRLAVLSEREIFGRHYVRRTRRRYEAGTGITSFSDLKSGDYIVHAVHGIGRYEGLRRFSGEAGDFLAVRYSGGDMLYIPVTQIDRIQKYEAGEDAKPKVDRLGGSTWAKTRGRVKKAVKDMTEDLLKLYASREAQQGHSFGPDTPWQREFEDSFEYEETPDQERAIIETKNDMESSKPMDRLVCGDVGFGKTEVALRAAFKAVMDAKQVAVLVPTTILAQQHYATFSERMADYPIRLALLSRFKTSKEVKESIEKLKTGEVDVVIGTHRLVSKDIQFKNLGLIIIDEEQRFGVAQKEKLKTLRSNVDVLTLSATPIPRTLHLSLMGIRDMSVINTAPNDRLPVHTCIDAFDEDLVREAIQRELAREGQAFFLHNRIQTIYAMADVIHKLVPDARIRVAHGQMPEHELEEVMTAFIRKHIDILVCTSIIGSGLDIPNANTILIDRADRFGLAELYQVRGRVGRYKHRAFAYLLVPGDRVPTEDAQKRLKALEEFSALGAGFRIAMRDLEIRGCGNILGGEQSGNIASVGYETYYQLIQETVAELKGEPVLHRILPPFDIAIDAYIPEDYVPSEAQKMTLYRRIAGILTVDGATEMLDELKDRFGRPPAPVVRLVDIMRIRARAADSGITGITATKERITLQLGTSNVNRRIASTLKQHYGAAISFNWNENAAMALNIGLGADPLKATEEFVKSVADCC
jgi:transcription-repair coupling factor (superfamily II helicase)